MPCVKPEHPAGPAAQLPSAQRHCAATRSSAQRLPSEAHGHRPPVHRLGHTPPPHAAAKESSGPSGLLTPYPPAPKPVNEVSRAVSGVADWLFVRPGSGSEGG